jgi:hypothetical protein
MQYSFWPMWGRDASYAYSTSSTAEEEDSLIANMAATMLRSLSKLGRPSTKYILNNNLVSPGCTVLQHR